MSTEKNMNAESILNQFEIVEESLRRAKLPFETNMLHEKVIEVSLWELIKSYHQIENIVREIDPKRFGVQQVTGSYIPEIKDDALYLCTICGDPECQSDHK